MQEKQVRKQDLLLSFHTWKSERELRWFLGALQGHRKITATKQNTLKQYFFKKLEGLIPVPRGNVCSRSRGQGA